MHSSNLICNDSPSAEQSHLPQCAAPFLKRLQQVRRTSHHWKDLKQARVNASLISLSQASQGTENQTLLQGEQFETQDTKFGQPSRQGILNQPIFGPMAPPWFSFHQTHLSALNRREREQRSTVSTVVMINFATAPPAI